MAGSSVGVTAATLVGRRGFLSPIPTTTILPVTDLERARRYYAETLGLPFVRKGPDGSEVFSLNEKAALALLEKPPGVQPEYTALSFEVPDIMTFMTEFEEKGVQFEDYDLPDLKTVDHIAVMGSEKAAWFKDPDGNILCLHEDGPER